MFNIITQRNKIKQHNIGRIIYPTDYITQTIGAKRKILPLNQADVFSVALE